METLLIELTHQKARDLLQDLEAMNIIKIVKSEPKDTPASQRFRGKLSDQTADALHKQITQSREEWSN